MMYSQALMLARVSMTIERTITFNVANNNMFLLYLPLASRLYQG